MGVMRKHDLTNKKTTTKTNTNTMTMKMTNTFREHPQKGISEDILNTFKWQSKRSSESDHTLLLKILTIPDQTDGV